MRVTRTHDALYLKENSYNKTREIFKFAYRLVKKNSHNKKIIGDFGCAAGEFLFFLRNKFNFNYKLIGFDINNLLLKKARKKVKNVDFIKQDLLKKNKKYKNFSYISTCIGVMTIFDDFYKVINNLIYYTKKKVEGGDYNIAFSCQ
jgi:ubiquinone/menaquinone biosynthesis C-methylase UbiE